MRVVRYLESVRSVEQTGGGGEGGRGAGTQQGSITGRRIVTVRSERRDVE